MGCIGKEKQPVRQSPREMIGELFAAEQSAAAFKHRLFQCTHATGCGRLCERLVKQPGKAGVYCVDVKTGEQIDLYTALEAPAFACPMGLF